MKYCYFYKSLAPVISCVVSNMVCILVNYSMQLLHPRSDTQYFDQRAYLWPWLCPPLMTLQYIMYFRFL